MAWRAKSSIISPRSERSTGASSWKRSRGTIRAPRQGNPYRGLDAFRPQDAPIFFGRGPETDALIARVGSARVVAVIGPSGSGKSSLVAAGLLPRLAAGALADSAEWLVVRFTPAEADEDPFRALALHLLPHGGTGQVSVDDLAERLRLAFLLLPFARPGRAALAARGAVVLRR